MSDDFVEEIKEEVRKDQLLKLWQEYGNVIIGAGLTILLFTGGYLFWDHYQTKKLNQQTLQYEKILEELQQKNKVDFSDLLKNGSQGYRLLGLLEQNNHASSQTQEDKSLQALAEDKSLNPFYREIAAIKTIMKDFDSTNGQVLLERLAPLSEKKSPLQPFVVELQAFAYLKLNQVAKAQEKFKAVLNASESQGALKLRARAMLEMLETSQKVLSK